MIGGGGHNTHPITWLHSCIRFGYIAFAAAEKVSDMWVWWWDPDQHAKEHSRGSLVFSLVLALHFHDLLAS